MYVKIRGRLIFEHWVWKEEKNKVASELYDGQVNRPGLRKRPCPTRQGTAVLAVDETLSDQIMHKEKAGSSCVEGYEWSGISMRERDRVYSNNQ